MIQFNLLGFPIRIHWPFWLTAALLGGALHAQTPAQIQRVFIWIVLVLVSIIIHELGHALTMRRFGDRRVEIALYALGGLAIGSSNHRTRLQQILISAAGPAAQIAAGLLVLLIYQSFPPSPGLINRAYQDFFFISFFWGHYL
jgi:Zn-dependent protease